MQNLLALVERGYAAVRIISLDVAAAALGGGILACRVIGSTPRPVFYFLLPAGVWVAYTVDHLLDAQRMGSTARTPRHRFHHRHAAVLWGVSIALAIACAVAGWVGLSWLAFIYGGIMCGLVIVHEAIIKLAGDRVSPLLIKELGVAIVFTAGVWGMPWLRHWLDTRRVLGWPIVLLVQYFLLALVNLIEFSIYEAKKDTADRQTSFVRGIGRHRAVAVVIALLAFQLPLGALALISSPRPMVIFSQVIYLLMTVGLTLVLRCPRWMARAERYRTLGDGVFLLPLLMALS